MGIDTDMVAGSWSLGGECLKDDAGYFFWRSRGLGATLVEFSRTRIHHVVAIFELFGDLAAAFVERVASFVEDLSPHLSRTNNADRDLPGAEFDS